MPITTDPEKIRKFMMGPKLDYTEDDFEIEYDGSVTVPELTVELNGEKLKCIPVQFHKVSAFNISENPLTTMEGCPRIVDTWFSCNFLPKLEKLTLPQFVGGDFECYQDNDSVMGRTADWYRQILLVTILGKIEVSNGAVGQILSKGRIRGEMPSELIPGKVKQLRDMCRDGKWLY